MKRILLASALLAWAEPAAHAEPDWWTLDVDYYCARAAVLTPHTATPSEQERLWRATGQFIETKTDPKSATVSVVRTDHRVAMFFVSEESCKGTAFFLRLIANPKDPK
jgi:hypothetical protein